jgi:uncharacterized membrane protein (UPF0127 family)
MKRILFIVIIIFLLCAGYFYFRHPLGEKIILNGHTLNLTLAVTDSEKELGLGYRDSLAPDSGMLFVYQNRDRYGFWMKGMRFPLDYIWINGTTIVDLSENIPAPKTPEERPVQLSPVAPVDKILEVNAGTIARLGLHIGDTVRFVN